MEGPLRMNEILLILMDLPELDVELLRPLKYAQRGAERGSKLALSP
jgi:hypothetical protein